MGGPAAAVTMALDTLGQRLAINLDSDMAYEADAAQWQGSRSPCRLPRFRDTPFLIALIAPEPWQPSSRLTREVEKRTADEDGGSQREVPGEHWYSDRGASDPRD